VRIKRQKPRIRHNRKVYDIDMERILIMRNEHHFTYKQIGEKLRLPEMTVFLALKRYKSRQNQHIDTRVNNGRHTPPQDHAPDIRLPAGSGDIATVERQDPGAEGGGGASTV